MRSEIRHIDAVRFANVVALVYAVLSLVCVVLMIPFFAMTLAFGDLDGALPFGIMLVLVLMYPIAGLFIGWLMGFLGAAIYNLVAGWVGGIYIELTTETAV
jgi:O-antigen/teichoic acid export membrane protein